MRTLTLLILISLSGFGQTAVDLGKQGKNIDFSAAPSTIPWKMGSVQPVSCRNGEAFFNTAADSGLNINLCINNAWFTFTGALGSLPVQAGSAGYYLRTNGSSLNWSNIVTGGTGGIDCASTPGVCDISTALVPFKSLANVWTGANDFSTGSFLKLKRGSGDPATGCSLTADIGNVYVRSDGPADNNLWICENNAGTPRWRRPMDGISIPDLTVSDNQWTGGNDFTGSSSIKLRRGAGNPATGCSVTGDIGGVYVRSDGAADNHLWICENNSGAPRWRRPMDGVSFPTMNTVDQGHAWLGVEAGTSGSGAFAAQQLRCWEFTNNWKDRQVGKATALVDTADAAGFATLSIYGPDGSLLGQSDTVSTASAGAITFTFTNALSLGGAVYNACLATTSTSVIFRASNLTSGGTLMLRGLSNPRLFTPANAATGTNPLTVPSTLGARTALGASLSPVAVVTEP